MSLKDGFRHTLNLLSWFNVDFLLNICVNPYRANVENRVR